MRPGVERDFMGNIRIFLLGLSILLLAGCAGTPASVIQYSPPAASGPGHVLPIVLDADSPDVEQAVLDLVHILLPDYHESGNGRLLMVFDTVDPEQVLDCGSLSVFTPADTKAAQRVAAARAESIFSLADGSNAAKPARRQAFVQCRTEIRFTPLGPGITGVKIQSEYTLDIALTRYAATGQMEGQNKAGVVTEKDRIIIGEGHSGRSSNPIPAPGEFITGESALQCVSNGSFEARILDALQKRLHPAKDTPAL